MWQKIINWSDWNKQRCPTKKNVDRNIIFRTENWSTASLFWNMKTCVLVWVKPISAQCLWYILVHRYLTLRWHSQVPKFLANIICFFIVYIINYYQNSSNRFSSTTYLTFGTGQFNWLYSSKYRFQKIFLQI